MSTYINSGSGSKQKTDFYFNFFKKNQMLLFIFQLSIFCLSLCVSVSHKRQKNQNLFSCHVMIWFSKNVSPLSVTLLFYFLSFVELDL